MDMKSSESAYYSGEHGLYHNHCQSMGTRLDVIMHGLEEEKAEQAFEIIYAGISDLEDKLSHFDPNSPISMINRIAAKKPVTVGEEIYAVLELCMEYYNKTSGLFDISMGKVTSENKSGRIESSIISELLQHTGMDKLSLDPAEKSVKFLNDQVEIDLGGFGKGFALDGIKTQLASMEITDAFISFGDSSILAIGNHPHGKGWKSGISHLLKPGESIFDFDLADESLSTSGTGPNNTRGGQNAHVLHPRKGLIDPGFQHVSAVSKLAIEAEILSTALLAASEEEKISLLAKFPDCRAVEIKYNETGMPQVQKYNIE
ncbi:MAG TPA: FAD:protein FMN transferase [Bacteroides sp.]|nr:FAD:protein FMN transferase [Bacteroides sp.]